MFTDKDYTIAKTLALNIDIPDDFGTYEDSDELYTDSIYHGCGEVKELNNEYEVQNGISKVVIVPALFHWVMKIPLNGRWVSVWNSEDEYDDECEYTFDSFMWADAPDDSDYCWDEMLKINAATKAGFGALFPCTELVAERSGKRYYIQEKVNPFYDFKSTSTPASIARAKEMDDNYKFCATEWRAAVIDYYGEEFWMNFVSWDNRQNSHILNDMHSGNYGFRDDGSPVIFDASGFND